MREQRKQRNATSREVPLRGRRNRKAATNSLQFLARVEGVNDVDGLVRGANGMKWRLP